MIYTSINYFRLNIYYVPMAHKLIENLTFNCETIVERSSL